MTCTQLYIIGAFAGLHSCGLQQAAITAVQIYHEYLIFIAGEIHEELACKRGGVSAQRDSI
jgi:hypothetical protein